MFRKAERLLTELSEKVTDLRRSDILKEEKIANLQNQVALQQNQLLELTDRLMTVTREVMTLQNEVKEMQDKQQRDCLNDAHSGFDTDAHSGFDTDTEYNLLNRMDND